MRVSRILIAVGALLLTAALAVNAAGIKMAISGEGAVNERTIQAGKPVSFDIIMMNDSLRAGITICFKIVSDDIKSVTHVSDSGSNCLNERCDVKGWNGFEDASIWDLYGMMVIEKNWDGALPELLGFGGICNKQKYLAHDWEKKLSFELIVDQPGTLVVDSSFYPPGGKWLYASPPGTIEAHEPSWGGPYVFKVIE